MRCAAALAALALLLPRAAATQDGPALVRQGLAAFENFEVETAASLLQRGLNPALGPQDSAWALGVQWLAQILSDGGDSAAVTAWARFGMRHAPSMRIDDYSDYVLEPVRNAFLAARDAVVPGADDALVASAWRWPVGTPGGPGRLEARVTGADGATVLVVGRGLVGSQGMTLPAGVYDVQVEAAGHRRIAVSREVLPGITTALVVDLAPARIRVAGVLPDAARDQALGRTARIAVERFGREAACASGAFLGRAGLLLTTYSAIRGAESVIVTLGGRQVAEGITVAAHDVAADLAVLALPFERSDSFPLAPVPEDAAYAWALAAPGCGDVAVARVQPGTIAADAPPRTPPGTPFINEAGALVGLWAAERRLVPATGAAALLEEARRQRADQATRALRDVAIAERHQFGSVELRSAAAGAEARIAPLEPWAQWPDLAVTSPLPLVYAAPAGRYRVELLLSGVVQRTVELVLRAGVADQLALAPEALAAEPGPALAAERRRGGGFPWLIAAVGGGGAAVAALLLLRPKESGTGGLTFTIPNQ